jgi:hypothetical protein
MDRLASKHSLSLFDSLPIIKRAKFDALPLTKQYKCILVYKETLRSMGVEYDDGTPINEFAMFKQMQDDKTFKVSMIGEFDQVMVRSVLSVKENSKMWQKTLTARQRLLAELFYTPAHLELDFLEEFDFPLQGITVKFADLDYFVRLIEACQEYSLTEQEEQVGDDVLLSAIAHLS